MTAAVVKLHTQYSDGTSSDSTETYDQLALDAFRMNAVQAISESLPATRASMTAAILDTMDAQRVMLVAALGTAIPVQYVLPGDGKLAKMPDESVLSVGPDGAVYLDGLRLGTAMVAKLVQAGKSIYGLGKSVPTWWRWTGTTWASVPAGTFDANILK